jgi:predicted dehydrogenase
LAKIGKAVAVAVVDINPAHLPHAAILLGLPKEKCYTDLRTAFRENAADFAIIVIPPAAHEQAVDLCLEFGLHILSEKPIADTMEGCCRVYRKVAATDRKMAVTMTHRFDRDKFSFQQLIHSGRYGGLDYLVGYTTWAWRAFPQWGAFRYRIKDPLLVESTVHQFDIMRSLAGANAKTVYARTWNPRWSEYEGHSQGLMVLEMENGVHVSYESAKSNATELTAAGHWRAECDRATLELDHRQMRVIRGDLHRNAHIEQVPLEEQPVWANAWLAEMFCDWVQGRRPDHPTAVADNLQCAALLFAAIQSAHSGNPVAVQDFLREHLADVP